AANAFLHATPDRREGPSADGRVEARAVVANCKTSMAEAAIATDSFSLAERLLFEAEQIAPDDYTHDRITATRLTLANARAAKSPKDGAVAKAPAEGGEDGEPSVKAIAPPPSPEA